MNDKQKVLLKGIPKTKVITITLLVPEVIVNEVLRNVMQQLRSMGIPRRAISTTKTK